jgi:hypothetical protein
VAQAEAVSDQDLAGSMIMGGDQHWELLPLQVRQTDRQTDNRQAVMGGWME